MKHSLVAIVSTISACAIFSSSYATEEITPQALKAVKGMTLREKIGQKIMLDFRYWCPTALQNNQPCTQDFTVMNATVKKILAKNHIGGVILFSNNLKDIAQITTLTDALQKAMLQSNQLQLLIGTDQEGGIVARLPRDVSVTFPGNMAIAAAYLGRTDDYATQIGKTIATDLKVLGINVDFAPDSDVNVNPLNPVINVRAFSDDPDLVTTLALELSRALQNEKIGSMLKHFPGHGDTITDSHLGLPVVNHHLEQAWAIDLYPFKNIIASTPPDLIMTAHIQYPALDDTQIYAEKIGQNIIAPATLSRKIQNDILREQLNYKGVVITDALNMGAIAQNFDPTDATIKAFQAGNDIALMPISITQPEDANKVEELITKIATEVKNGNISEKEITNSAYRIVDLKVKLGLFPADTTSLPDKIARAQAVFEDENQRTLEMRVTDAAITLVQNNDLILPLRKLSANTRIHIITPWLEQGAGIAKEMTRLQQEQQIPADIQVDFVRIADTNLDTEKAAIDNADIIIVGDSSTKSLPVNNGEKFRSNIGTVLPSASLVFPTIPQGDSTAETTLFKMPNHLIRSTDNTLTDAEFAYQALQYAKNHGKKTIFISLLAPYDLPNFRSVSDAMLVSYDFYGYLVEGNKAYYRGPSMQALTRIIFGINSAQAKLPVNVPDPNNPDQIIYKRGFGLNTRT